MLDFTGYKVVVTGGSRGIGRATALAFAKKGAAVSICARGESSLRQTEGELSDHAGKGQAHKIHAAVCDLADDQAIDRYIAAAAAALGGVDVLINNATGYSEETVDAWKDCLTVDVMAAVRASDAALPHLAQSGKASIINISSISGLRPSMRTPAYAAAKAALIQYTTSQALALAAQGIRVNCIAPGSVEFPGGYWEKRKTTNPDLYEATLKSIPFGRYGRADEIANVAEFLASPMASWVTGQTIVADGGQVLGG
ncbi:SDR family NAD(P)-dependent oxidoreductase [Dongia soli]|uniref:SDR family oxidoreductase n=1 Tax=Dongia soli TaxID=600628 RepID=A0ABU5EEG0_9PROT|nr:SDR family oxidoreductase [Dongia soli]MDY0884606.1 SDR family oxidoreductase [Dongia soli]